MKLTPRRGDLRADIRWFGDAPHATDLVAPVTVWLHVPDVGGDRDAAKVAPWLSEAERARRDRIQHPRAYAEFLAGRLLLRTVFAEVLDVDPADVRLVENKHGALALDPAHHAARGRRFNISHTDGLLAFALASAPVGIDVEWITRPGRTVELADRYFAPAEIAALHALAPEHQRDRFFDLWTLKESYIKARGMGLAIPLRDFAFAIDGLDRFGPAGITLATAPSIRDIPDDAWRFRLDQLGPDHRLAAALARSNAEP